MRRARPPTDEGMVSRTKDDTARHVYSHRTHASDASSSMKRLFINKQLPCELNNIERYISEPRSPSEEEEQQQMMIVLIML